MSVLASSLCSFTKVRSNCSVPFFHQSLIQLFCTKLMSALCIMFYFAYVDVGFLVFHLARKHLFFWFPHDPKNKMNKFEWSKIIAKLWTEICWLRALNTLHRKGRVVGSQEEDNSWETTLPGYLTTTRIFTAQCTMWLYGTPFACQVFLSRALGCPRGGTEKPTNPKQSQKLSLQKESGGGIHRRVVISTRVAILKARTSIANITSIT